MNKLGTSRDGGTIQYVAWGSGGCHTYLDYNEESSFTHADPRIENAWRLCSAESYPQAG